MTQPRWLRAMEMDFVKQKWRRSVLMSSRLDRMPLIFEVSRVEVVSTVFRRGTRREPAAQAAFRTVGDNSHGKVQVETAA